MTIINQKLFAGATPFIICLLIGCSRPDNQGSQRIPPEESWTKYAENLKIKQTAIGVEVTIGQPFKGSSRPVKYLLTTKESQTESGAFDATIQVPVKSVAATATSQAGFIAALNAGKFLSGFSTTDFISSPKLRRLVESGYIQELGMDSNISIETLIQLAPDLLIGYSASNDVARWEQIVKLGTPVIYDASFLETSPLAQAEWIKLFGALFGLEHTADSVFSIIENSYLELATLQENTEYRPTIICGTMYNGTWFMPGGESWVATYIDQAGGNYLWKDLDQTGTKPLSFEAVYERSLNADYWIGATAFSSIDQILNEDERYSKFNAVNAKTIYSPTKRQNGLGGNDYYESALVRPDLVLKDFIKIVHPELLPDHELFYYQKLK